MNTSASWFETEMMSGSERTWVVERITKYLKDYADSFKNPKLNSKFRIF